MIDQEPDKNALRMFGVGLALVIGGLAAVPAGVPITYAGVVVVFVLGIGACMTIAGTVLNGRRLGSRLPRAQLRSTPRDPDRLGSRRLLAPPSE